MNQNENDPNRQGGYGQGSQQGSGGQQSDRPDQQKPKPNENDPNRQGGGDQQGGQGGQQGGQGSQQFDPNRRQGGIAPQKDDNQDDMGNDVNDPSRPSTNNNQR